MITMPQLEMHVADQCNLSCEGCNHYANYHLRGVLPLSDGGVWLEAWSQRITPLVFSFLGGEPLLNPELPEYLLLARRLWPDTHLEVDTNGLLLSKRSDLWPALQEARATIMVSVHSDEERYRSRLELQLQHARAEASQRHVPLRTRNCIDNWYRPYLGFGTEMQPFQDGDPIASWSACRARYCVTLRDNCLWKCPPLAHLPRVAEKFGLERNPAWDVPLAYQPMRIDASEDELDAFLARGPEPACSMCPSRLEFFIKAIH
jgi:hypothetical protein